MNREYKELRGPIHAEDLMDMVEQGCGNPNCKSPDCKEGLFMKSKCHPDFGTLVEIIKDKLPLVLMRCAVCGHDICWIRIANRPAGAAIALNE